MNIAIVGGSFNPPTKAHEAIALACLNRPEFDEVWVMPSGDRLDKAYSIDDSHRLAMLKLVSQRVDDPRLFVSSLELELDRPSQTIKTLGAMATKYPDVNPTFVLGVDSYWSMPSLWVQGDYLQQQIPMLVIPRADSPNPEASNVKILEIGKEFRDVSSSEVRARVAAGETISHLVDSWVEEYIVEHGLYGYNSAYASY